MVENMNNGLMKILPLDYREVFTTSKMILLAKEKINEIVKLVNALENSENAYTNEKIGEVENKITELTTKLESGNFIKDHTINADKMDMTFVDDLQNYIMRYLGQCVQMVTFGLNEDGYFVAYIPRSWKDIQFFTNESGQLCLKILQPSQIDTNKL